MSKYRTLTEREREGLSATEEKICVRQVSQYGPMKSSIGLEESLPLYEMYLIGHSYREISEAFPQYKLSHIIATGALRGWYFDKQKTMGTLKDVVQTKVVKSIIEQVSLLTGLLSVSSVENANAIRAYVESGGETEKPAMAIASMKEYQTVSENLFKIIKTIGTADEDGSVLKVEAPRPRKNKVKKTEKEVLNITDVMNAETTD